MPKRILRPAEALTEEEHSNIDNILLELGKEVKGQAPEVLTRRVIARRSWGVPDDGRCLCEACCWGRVREAVEADKKRPRRTPEQIVKQWENLR